MLRMDKTSTKQQRKDRVEEIMNDVNFLLNKEFFE